MHVQIEVPAKSIRNGDKLINIGTVDYIKHYGNTVTVFIKDSLTLSASVVSYESSQDVFVIRKEGRF